MNGPFEGLSDVGVEEGEKPTMTTGSQLNSISCQVAQLENQIKQETLRLIAEGTRPAVDDPGYQAFFDKLKPWYTSLG